MDNIFLGVASKVGVPDKSNDIITNFLNKDGDSVEIRYRHLSEPIGKGLLKFEDGEMKVYGTISKDFKEEIPKGLSIGGSAKTVTQMENGGKVYKDVFVTEISLTPNPANQLGEIKIMKEEEATEMDETQIKQIVKETIENDEIKKELDELRAENESLKLSKELDNSTLIISKEEEEKETIKAFDKLLKEMPEKGVMNSFTKEYSNQSGMAVSNILANLAGAFSAENDLVDKAGKIGVTGMTLASDPAGTEGLNDLFVAGSDKNKTKTALVRSVRPQMAYSYFQMDKATLLSADSNGSVTRYIGQELEKQAKKAIARQMIYGSTDGTNAIYGLKDDATGWTTQVTGSKYYEVILDAVASVSYSAKKTIYMNGVTFANLKKEAIANKTAILDLTGGYTAIAQGFGASDLQVVDYMDNNDIAVVADGEFLLAGTQNTIGAQDFDIRYNVDKFIYEILVGGSISGVNRSAFGTITIAS